jgi:hypothetical protein
MRVEIPQEAFFLFCNRTVSFRYYSCSLQLTSSMGLFARFQTMAKANIKIVSAQKLAGCEEHSPMR